MRYAAAILPSPECATRLIKIPRDLLRPPPPRGAAGRREGREEGAENAGFVIRDYRGPAIVLNLSARLPFGSIMSFISRE